MKETTLSFWIRADKDRRSVVSRRMFNFGNRGPERRKKPDRRSTEEQRTTWERIGRWVSMPR